MGKDLVAAFPSAKDVFDEADEVLGFSLSKLCFEGPEEELQLTENTQPAILACSIATLTVLRQKGYRADFVAGHSLGEYSALVAAGAFSFADAIRLVRDRGRYMQEAVPPGEGAMAAILGLDQDSVAKACEQAAQGEVVSPANLNSPNQIVIAGHTKAVKRAVELTEDAGAFKAVMLPVSAPFHCALMEPARERLEPALDAINFQNLNPALVNNYSAEVVFTGAAARQGLKNQIPNPVRWEASIRKLAAEGVVSFVEVGPGRVLTAFLRGIDRSLKGVAVGNVASLEKLSS